jgi:hypothetical protein
MGLGWREAPQRDHVRLALKQPVLPWLVSGASHQLDHINDSGSYQGADNSPTKLPEMCWVVEVKCVPKPTPKIVLLGMRKAERKPDSQSN